MSRISYWERFCTVLLDKKGTVFPSVGQLTINIAMIHVTHPYNFTVSRKITPSNPVALITHHTPVLRLCNNTNVKLSLYNPGQALRAPGV